jgi:hypothetical protein
VSGTGWRPRSIEPLLSFQPMVGTAGAENLLFLARGADYVGVPEDINEAERIDWIPLDEILDHIEGGEIVGAASVIGLMDVLIRRQRGELKA